MIVVLTHGYDKRRGLTTLSAERAVDLTGLRRASSKREAAGITAGPVFRRIWLAKQG
jgi:hypothetical protein